jgi:hypothetical protein
LGGDLADDDTRVDITPSRDLCAVVSGGGLPGGETMTNDKAWTVDYTAESPTERYTGTITVSAWTKAEAVNKAKARIGHEGTGLTVTITRVALRPT